MLALGSGFCFSGWGGWWGGGGVVNNASCQRSNKDKINLPAGAARPFPDYFHICILVIAGLGQ